MRRTDAECVQLCLDGHPEVFRELVQRYQGPLYSYLTGRLRDESEVTEAAQEAMVRAYFSLKKLQKRESFYSWLLGIAERIVQEMLRARGRQAGLFDADIVRDDVADSPTANNGPDVELSHALEELPDVLRQVVLMRFYEEQSCDEISRNLGVPIGTITSRLSRAYARLRRSLRTLRDLEVDR